MARKRWLKGFSVRGLRFRLIGWYLVLLLLTLTFFSIYIFFQFRSLQQSQQDATLQAAMSTVRSRLARPNPGEQSPPKFQTPPNSQNILQDLNRDNIQARILNADGTVGDTLGSSINGMPINFPPATDYATVISTNNVQWRILSQPFGPPSNPVAWLQVGQPLQVLNTEFNSLFFPILLGAGLALILSLLGGLFLADRALQPIDRVTRTAQAISTRDLSRRINYTGPPDEIGRLAKTLDQMLERLEKGFDQERRFTSDASHELRTPLTALKGRIEVALSRTRNPQEYQQTLADLNQEVDRLVRLSNSLLYLARLDQSNYTMQIEMLNLSDLLDSIVDSMESVADLKSIELTSDIAPDVSIEGNLDQLTRLFLNLVDNAIKYTPNGGKVQVKLKRPENDRGAIVTVSDTGPGIAAEHLPHLFERFYRADSDRASNSGGAGLGLAIAYEIARQHNGHLEVESQPGQGTTFRVLLPSKF